MLFYITTGLCCYVQQNAGAEVKLLCFFTHRQFVLSMFSLMTACGFWWLQFPKFTRILFRSKNQQTLLQQNILVYREKIKTCFCSVFPQRFEHLMFTKDISFIFYHTPPTFVTANKNRTSDMEWQKSRQHNGKNVEQIQEEPQKHLCCLELIRLCLLAVEHQCRVFQRDKKGLKQMLILKDN